MNNKIIMECDKCEREDTINSVNGLCPSCEETIVDCNKCKKNLVLGELNKNEWDEWVKEGSFICSSCINKEMFRESK